MVRNTGPMVLALADFLLSDCDVNFKWPGKNPNLFWNEQSHYQKYELDITAHFTPMDVTSAYHCMLLAMFWQSLGHQYGYLQNWYKHWIYISVMICSIMITNHFCTQNYLFTKFTIRCSPTRLLVVRKDIITIVPCYSMELINAGAFICIF